MRKDIQKLLLWLLSRESVSRFLEDKTLDSQPPPTSWPLGFDADAALDIPPATADRRGPVFVTSRYRSGSTLLWRFFRHSPEFTAYYEPLNPRCWFDESVRGNRVDSTHRGVSDYWQEYASIARHQDIPWSKEWASRDFYLPPTVPRLKLQKYLSSLVDSASQRPVLQFNRCDFRLHWLRTYFPTCQILHLCRDPRDQWLSTFLKGSPVDLSATMSDFLAHDEFYLVQWTRDLRRWFPVFREIDTWHPYEASYLISRLSNLYGRNFSDLTITYEDLVSNPAQSLQAIESVVGGGGLSQSEVLTGLDSKSVGRWEAYASDHWFSNSERKVDDLLEKMGISSPESTKPPVMTALVESQ